MAHESMLKALVSKGYFPKELPPTFTTNSFGTHVAHIINDWELKGVYRKNQKIKIKGRSKSNSYSYIKLETDAELVSMPKRGFERRSIAITHPVPQALLSYELTKNWKDVQKWLLRQTYSMDQIRISDSFERAIKGINFEAHRAKKDLIDSSSEWILKTDISRFYPSIYTHSIPWAAYGKEKVKNNLKMYEGSFADRIDGLVRACNRNQTIGLPIGPETSRIIAEIISSRLDSEIHAKHLNLAKGFADRLQDDWFVGAPSLEQAEIILSNIILSYRAYGLEINGSKTSVERLVNSMSTRWVAELASYLAHRPGPLKGNRLREYLSLGARLQAECRDEAVTSYVLSSLEAQPIERDDVEVIESFLLRASATAPGSLNIVCRLLINLQFQTKGLSLPRISDRLISIAEIAASRGNLYEVMWILHALRGLRLHLKSKVITNVSEYLQSSCISIILLDLKSKGLCPGLLPTHEWQKQISDEQVRSSWSWLLAYEAYRHGWLPDPAGLMSKSLFAPLISRGVVFYNELRNVPSSREVVAARRKAKKRNQREAHNIVQSIRGFSSNYF